MKIWLSHQCLVENAFNATVTTKRQTNLKNEKQKYNKTRKPGRK